MRSFFTALGLATLGFATTALPVFPGSQAAAQVSDEEDRRRSRQTLTNSVGRAMGEIFELINAEPQDLAGALERLTQLAQRDIPAYDRATVLEIRGTVYAGLENYSASLRDFEEVLRLDVLPNNRTRQITYSVAQLYFQEENYPQAVRFMRQYLEASDETVQDSNAWYILAAAYVSMDDYRNARRPAESALEYDEEKAKKNYDLLNLIYSNLELDRERLTLLEQMISRYPNESGYWEQLASIYGAQDRPGDALGTIEVAYKTGLLTKPSIIIALAQYYSSFDNPYRGAKIIQQEMAAGTVERNLQNLELLSQLWSMAREQENAIEALTAAARISPSGELYYRLGQSYIADEQFQQAVTSFREALRRGGLSRNDTGDIYLLLGNALFNIDSDTDRGLAAARREFVRATQYTRQRSSAQGWVDYIDAIVQTRQAAEEVRLLQLIASVQQQVDACETILELRSLGGDVDRERAAECETLISEAEDQIASLQAELTAARGGGGGDAPEATSTDAEGGEEVATE